MNAIRDFYNNKVAPMLKAFWSFVSPILCRLVWPTMCVLFLLFVLGGAFAYMKAGPIWVPLAFFMAVFFVSSPAVFFQYIWYLITGK